MLMRFVMNFTIGMVRRPLTRLPPRAVDELVMPMITMLLMIARCCECAAVSVLGAAAWQFGALVGFFWTLVSIVQSFNPDTASAVLFYCLAGLAAVRCVTHRRLPSSVAVTNTRS
jgi:uncharacterized membrane protein YuzA (DUF378 family)